MLELFFWRALKLLGCFVLNQSTSNLSPANNFNNSNMILNKDSRIYSANYVCSALCELNRYFDSLPMEDTYRLNNNLVSIEQHYIQLHNLVLADLERALKSFGDGPKDKDSAYWQIQELHGIFQDLAKLE